MILLDTQALIWWSTAPQYLSKKALKTIEKETKKEKVLVSSITVWEMYLLVKKRKIRFTVDIDSLIENLEKTPYIQFIPIDNRIAAKSVLLPDPLHRDPADRIIIATALALGAKVITSDKKILTYPHVQSLW